MCTPAISVVMSVYSEPIQWIAESIDSVLQQTFRDFEFIIINDNPSRIENGEFLQDCRKKDSRIILLQNEANIGLTKSLNKGLEIAKGKYIARMDADDISVPTRFQKQFDFMESHPDTGICGSWIKYFGGKESVCQYPEIHAHMFLFFKSVFAHPVVFIRKEILSGHKLKYDENIRYSQDYDLWERMYPYTQFYNLPEVLLHYRISGEQISSNHTQEQLGITSKIRRRAFNRYCDLNRIKYSIPIEITLKDIIRYKQVFIQKEPDSPFDVKEVLYYIYRSVNKNYIKTFLYFLYSGDCFKFSFTYCLKIVYCYFYNRKEHQLFS